MGDRPWHGRISRRGALAAGLGITMGGLLTACDGGSNEDVVGPTSDGELVLGVSLELTGQGSALGKLQQRALKITMDDINVTGIRIGDKHRRVRLIVEDNRGDAAVAATIAGKLIDERVSAIIGGITAETSLAMIKVAEARNVPMLSLSGADEIALPLMTRKFTYKLAPNASDIARVIALEIQRQGLKKISILVSTDASGTAATRALSVALRAIRSDARKDNVLDTVTLPRSGKDLGGAVARAIDEGPDAVIVWATAPTSGEVARELREAGFTGKIFFDPGVIADDMFSSSYAAALEGAFVCSPMVLGGAPLIANTPSSRATRTFVNRYNQEFGSFSGFAPYASDAVWLVASAARRAKSTDPRRLRGSLEAIPYEGVAGAYAFSPIDHGGLAPDVLTIFTVHQREWIRLS
ncbi:branched-chain amino acid transport system substrate-binding protein [Allocatelliglobosispora scoriae]|uniref:Branched-chain amino acid transport system substrate-binding protein n=1 Tax=Allocatelliglobosispora scoriae TaxID=643052 RepID=A0A841BUI6_9ACTN|nr:ABC transporter substrate-binding protein [Allocatelliglobosispora scoriae]MBB5870411.1 branched-chain amino acid transport system substrate-binding protein [Allocatelliglobosispora scoriae]